MRAISNTKGYRVEILTVGLDTLKLLCVAEGERYLRACLSITNEREILCISCF